MLRNNKGFTLIEMLLVILIIGFLVGILAIRASDVGSDAKKKSVAADLKSLKAAVEAYYVQNSEFPPAGYWESALVKTTPRLIDEVPDDSYASSGDYKYKLTDPYYVIYSVGPNGADDSTAVSTGDYGTVTEGDDDIWVSNCAVHNHGGY